MTSTATSVVYDPTLLLLVPVLWQPTVEDARRTEERRAAITATFDAAPWIPKEKDWLRTGTDGDRALYRCWEAPPTSAPLDGFAADGGWFPQSFGISYHETISVLLGVGRHKDEGLAVSGVSDWVEEAQPLLTSSNNGHAPWDSLRSVLDRAYSFGAARIWTGEWAAPPQEGWKRFGRARYPSGFAVFPWGLLGRSSEPSVGDGALGGDRFDLHTVHDPSNAHDRDTFLLNSLVVIVTEFLKVTSYLWPRYLRERKLLVHDEQLIMDLFDPEVKAAEEIFVPASHENVQALNRALFPLSKRLGNLRYDLLSIKIAREAIRQEVEASRGRLVSGKDGSQLASVVSELEAQVESDVAYFSTAEQCGQTAMSSLQIDVGIDNAQAGNMIASAHLVLASLGFGLALAGGFWPVLQALLTHSVDFGGISVPSIVVRLILDIFIGVIGAFLSWHLWLWRFPKVYSSLHDRLVAALRPRR